MDFRILPGLGNFEKYKILPKTKTKKIAERLNKGWIILAAYDCAKVEGELAIRKEYFIMGKGEVEPLPRSTVEELEDAAIRASSAKLKKEEEENITDQEAADLAELGDLVDSDDDDEDDED